MSKSRSRGAPSLSVIADSPLSSSLRGDRHLLVVFIAIPLFLLVVGIALWVYVYSVAVSGGSLPLESPGASRSLDNPFIALNALFTALGFLGAITAILFQYWQTHKTIKQKDAERAISTFLTVMELLEECREQRRLLRRMPPSREAAVELAKQYAAENPSSEFRTVDQVARSLDILGLLYRAGTLQTILVTRFYQYAVLPLWETTVLKDYVTEIRAQPDPEHPYRRGPLLYTELVELIRSLEFDRVRFPERYSGHAKQPGAEKLGVAAFDA